MGEEWIQPSDRFGRWIKNLNGSIFCGQFSPLAYLDAKEEALFSGSKKKECVDSQKKGRVFGLKVTSGERSPRSFEPFCGLSAKVLEPEAE